MIVSLGFVALLASVLFWAIRSGQFDDLEGHGHQILMDEDDIKEEPDKPSAKEQNKKTNLLR